MRDENDRGSGFPVQRLEQIEHSNSRRGVEIPGRLVSKENSRIVGEGACNRNALLFSSGELHWKMVSAISQSDALEQLIGARGRSIRPLKLEGNLNVLASGECGNQLKALKDEADFFAPQLRSLVFRHCGEVMAVEDHLALRWCIETCQKAEERCLAASGRPDDGDESALWNRKRDIAKNGDLLVAALVLACNFLCNEHSDIDWIDGRIGVCSRCAEENY